MNTDNITPKGELILKTMAMPADTNANGDMFGGWTMSQMDIAGAILAKEYTRGRTVTVAVSSVDFIAPIKVGDIVCCYGHVSKSGRTSITIELDVWVKPILRNTEKEQPSIQVTSAQFTYVAVDNDGNKRVIPTYKG
ncbi:MAG: acyl-CoA thioester hydrolase YciA [Gammaproteobacteria bacterium]|nr:MAG: acyl-CoA thioester hydrolase YciA [Gammaproteobacteria bacterium]